MKKFIEDVLYCLKISLYIFIPTFILGLIIGYILYGTYFNLVVIVACRVGYIVGVVGLALAGLSFPKQNLMRPLNYQKQWEMYFAKLNLSHVCFFIGIFIFLFSAVIEIIAVG